MAPSGTPAHEAVAAPQHGERAEIVERRGGARDAPAAPPRARGAPASSSRCCQHGDRPRERRGARARDAGSASRCAHASVAARGLASRRRIAAREACGQRIARRAEILHAPARVAEAPRQLLEVPALAGAPPRERAGEPGRPRATSARRSARRGTTISAAAVGVGARRSATKSAMVKSTSCPTADTIGSARRRDRARDAFLVEATRGPRASRRRARRSAPRGRDGRSGRRSPAQMSLRRPDALHAHGRTTTCSAGQRERRMTRMSWSAAPESAVAIPIARREERQRPLAASSKSPSAARRAFSCSKASCSAPRPCGSIVST